METIRTPLVIFNVSHQVLAIEERLVKKVIKGPKSTAFLGMRPPKIGFFLKKRVSLMDLKATLRLAGNRVRFPGQTSAVIIFESGGRYFAFSVDHLYPSETKEVNPLSIVASSVPTNMTDGSFDWEETSGVVLRLDSLVRSYIRPAIARPQTRNGNPIVRSK
jgi:chemotaxis signal transduction protein